MNLKNLSGTLNNIKNSNNFKYLYINIDDTYLHSIQAKNISKNCFRVLCIHQGKDKNNNLINKTLLTINIKNKNKEEFTNFLKTKIEKIYGSLTKYKIILLSDGAKLFKYLANQFNAIHVLDKFHCLRSIRYTFNYYSRNKILKDYEANLRNKRNYFYYKQILKAIYAKNWSKIDFWLSFSYNHELFETKKKQIKNLYKYLKINWSAITIWNNPKFITGCLTETYVQSIIKRIKGAFGKIYSLKSIQRIIQCKSIYFNFSTKNGEK